MKTTTTTKAAKRTSVKKAPATLYWFDMTPAGRILRAYFLALITAQIGTLKADAAFKLWPRANVAGHLATGRLKRKTGLYALTTAGINYFSDPKQAPETETMEAMLQAVRTGEKPKCYNYAMQALK